MIGTDHNLVGARVSLKKPVFQPQFIRTRRIGDIDVSQFEKEFLQSGLEELYMEPDVDIAVEILEMKIMRVIEKLAPEIGFQTRVNSAPWMNREIVDLIKKHEPRKVRIALQEGSHCRTTSQVLYYNCC